MNASLGNRFVEKGNVSNKIICYVNREGRCPMYVYIAVYLAEGPEYATLKI